MEDEAFALSSPGVILQAGGTWRGEAKGRNQAGDGTKVERGEEEAMIARTQNESPRRSLLPAVC